MAFGSAGFGRSKARGHGGGGGGHGGHDDDLMITPLLDLFVALIPFLILSVVLSKISVVDVAVSKPVAVVKKTTTNFDLRLVVGKTSANIELNGKKVKTIPVAAGWTDELHAELVQIKKSNIDEFQIRIEPATDSVLEDIMGVMDAARHLNESDEPIIKKDGPEGKPVKLKYLFPNVVLRGVYS
ncbi:MAG TPA: biopolymer transporter ExbD [Bdellovibrionota bacterium]|nr:biopolymer transporter ExbD [Bdellovibrionota bacterium]